MRAPERGQQLRRRHAVYALLGAALAAACANDLALDLEGKLCRDGVPQCLDGYVCDANNRCVPEGEGAGAGGTEPSQPLGGAGGRAGEGQGGNSGNGATGGSSPSGGTPGVGGATAGAGASGGVGEVGDAAPPDLGDGATCVPVTLYEDRDGDEVGDTTRRMVACPTAGWVEQFGDCRDDLKVVHPGQLDHFDESFPDPEKSGGVSYDYDCSDTESPDPTNNPNTIPPAGGCSGLLTCTGAGYLPATPPRSGTGIEPRCGSNLRRTCISPAALTCANEDVAVAAAFRCK